MARSGATPLLQGNNLLNNFNSHSKCYSNHHSSMFYSSSFVNNKSLDSSSSSLFTQNSVPPGSLITRVSTAPVEYAPPAPDFDFYKEIARLKAIKSKLEKCSSLKERFYVIDSDSRVRLFFNRNRFARVLESLNLDEYKVYLLKCLVAAGQEHVIGLEFEFSAEVAAKGVLKSALYALAEMIEKWDAGVESECLRFGEEEVVALTSLFKVLAEVEEFYDCIGGIIGYQSMVLELLAQATYEEQVGNWSYQTNKLLDTQFMEIHPPDVIDLSRDTGYASQAALWGIEGLPDLGEIYPLGGSADRLGLVDPETGECLPAAMLPYCGRTLLEGLIRDLQAREFLFFKLYGKQCITPVAVMTSAAKNNHERIVSLCERHNWFGRGRSRFQLFEQPLVPAVSAKDGQWIVSRQFTPVCKPGGHGAIWKLAYDKGVFQWFCKHGRKGATVRQVSNVVAATDSTLLALAGIGLRYKKKLGFASCKRNTGATEGINVKIEKKTLDGKWSYGVSCIEYTEFDKFGIVHGSHSSKSNRTLKRGNPLLQDGPEYIPSVMITLQFMMDHSLVTSEIVERIKSQLADFPANTNILYIDLPSVEAVVSGNNLSSLPGMVLNVKKPVSYDDQFGVTHYVSGGRLECTMQNIADNFSNTFSSRCYDVKDGLDTYIVYNERRKVTSSAKKKRRHGDKSLHQTPDGSLLDILRNAYDLLSHCDISIPEILGNENYVDSGPPFLILLHPALGPLWEVTRQKFHGGSISKGSELQIEVAEFFWREVQLDGSLIILAENVMGSSEVDVNGETVLRYGKRCGRCKLENVKVLNEGIDWNSGCNLYWKHDVHRIEAVKVILHGNAEFEAENVTLQGNHVFEVPDGCKMKITSGNKGLEVQLNPIHDKLMDTGSWFWRYWIKGTNIQLEMVEL